MNCFIMCIAVLVPLLSGCGIHRGMPGHGGGKRFDEEQRAVATAVRMTIGAMKLAELRGLTVRVVLDNVAHSGGGTNQWPGLETVNLSGGSAVSESASELWKVAGSNHSDLGWNPNTASESNSRNGSVGTTLRLDPKYSASAFNSDPDLGYLRACLQMRLLHEGINLVIDANGKADATFFVLVDVLGTNCSRADAVLWEKDDLAASCELTYYAFQAGKSEMLFPARREGAEARYAETGVLFVAGLNTNRSGALLGRDRLAGIPVYAEASLEAETANP